MAQYQVSAAWVDVIRQGSPLARVSSAWADIIYSDVQSTHAIVSSAWVEVIRSVAVKTDIQPVTKLTAYTIGRAIADDHIEAPKITVYSVGFEPPVTATSTLTGYAALGIPGVSSSKASAYAVMQPLLTTAKISGYVVMRNIRRRRAMLILQGD